MLEHIKTMSDNNNTEIVKQVAKDFPIKKKIPSKLLHFDRNKYNTSPVGGTLLSNGNNIFYDEGNNIWHKMPWYYTIFHNAITNVKLIHFDANVIGSAVGSSEIIVPKIALQQRYDGKIQIPINQIKDGSYNYRDLYVSGRWTHFLADILPNVIYCKCVGH